MASKRHNIPKYGKNLRRSAGHMAKKLVETSMPSLSQTVINTREVYNDIRQFSLKQRSQFNTQKKYQKNSLLRPITEIINNAKDDLKSGKFYNEERIAENQTKNMSEFLDVMSGDQEYEENDSTGISSASFDRFLSTTSANSMNSTRALTDTQVKTTEYLGELSISNHMQNMVMGRRNHLEQIQKLDNLEKIGMSLAEFNVKTMTQHIKVTHKFYDEIIAEARDIKKSIDKISNNINSRYGTGRKAVKSNSLDAIFGGAGFNISAYKDAVKKNISDMIPINLDMAKMAFGEFKSSPISAMMNLMGSFITPKNLSKSAGKLDKSIQGLFSKAFLSLNDWRYGKTGSDGLMGIIKQSLGNIFGVDLNVKNKPDLSQYKNQSITLEMEQKKHKAITEVIPSYLSEILKTMSGKDVYYNYNKGMFENRKEARQKAIDDKNAQIAYGMDNTTQKLSTAMYEAADNLTNDPKAQKALEKDVKTFMAWIVSNMKSNDANDDNFNPGKYRDLAKYYKHLEGKGLRLSGGYRSFAIICQIYMSDPGIKATLMSELMAGKAHARDVHQRWNDDLLSSGQSALFNGMDDYEEERVNIRFNRSNKDAEKYLKKFKPRQDDYYSDRYRASKNKDLNIVETNNSGKGLVDELAKKTGLTYLIDTLKGATEKITGTVSTYIDAATNKIDSLVTNDSGDGYGEINFDFDSDNSGTESVSQTVAKANAKVTKKIKGNVIRKRKGGQKTRVVSPGNISRNIVDYRPYFDTIDSHLRNIATIIAQDKTLQVSSNPTTGTMTGIMTGASKKLKETYSVGKEKVGEVLNSLKNKVSEIRSKIDVDGIKGKAGGILSKIGGFLSGAKGKIGEFISNIDGEGIKEKANGLFNKGKGALSKVKEDGFSLLSKIANGISETGGNVIDYFKSDKFKDLLSSVKDKLKSGAGKVKDFAGTLFDKIKNGSIGDMLKKGKGMAIGALISNSIGLGPIPGAIIGSLFNKNKKNNNKEDKEIEGLENPEKGGLLDKFKGKKKKSVLMGGAISSMLGLGPIPGALVTMIYNKKFVKKDKENKDEENQAKDIAEGIENAEKQSKGIGKGKKLKNLTMGAMASSLLGLGPMPGVIAASIFNKHKDKVAKKKAKEENKEGLEAAESIEGVTDEKKSGGFFSKIKQFFGKGKNLAVGAIASTMLGLGPMPGIIASSIYNKHKYKKSKSESIKDTMKENLDNEMSKTSDSSEAKNMVRENKKLITNVERARDAYNRGDTETSEKLEEDLIQNAKTSGNLDGTAQAQSLVANTRDASGGGAGKSKDKIENPQSEGLFSKLGKLFGGGGGGLGNILGTILAVAAPFLLNGIGGNVLKWLKEKYGGHDTTNEQGDANFVNWTDNVGGAFSTGTSILAGNAARKLGLGIKGGLATAGAVQSFKASSYYRDEAKAYSDRGASTLAQEENMVATKHAAKGVYYGVKGAKAFGKSKLGVKLINAIKSLLNHKTVLKYIKKLKLDKAINGIKNFFTNNADNIIKKITTKAPKLLTRIGTKLGAFVSVVVAWLPLATAIVAFINGWNNAPRDLGIDETFNGFWKARFSNALIYALDDLLCGALDIIGLRDNISEAFTKLLMSDKEEAQLTKSQESQLNEYEQFLKDNNLNREGFTADMYNKMKHKSIWGHVKSWFGADDLSKYKTGGSKNTELQAKYGGYTEIDMSENTNIVIDDSTGAGGRGISSKSSNSEIIKYAQKKLQSNIYSNNTNRLKDSDIEKYTKSESYKKQDNEKSGNIFTNIGNTIKNAWNWLKTTVGGWFSGSGGRGNVTNNYTYYNQKDPRWANQSFGKYFGKRDTVKEGGCGPTVAAMALEQLTGKQVLPSTMANLAMMSGEKYDDGGTDPSFFNTAGSIYGVNFTNTPGFNSATVQALKSGSPVPLLGRNGPYGSGNHYLLATGIDSSGRISILDPQNKRNNKKFSASELSKNTRASMIAGAGRNNKYVKKLRMFARGTEDITDMQQAIVNEALSRVGDTHFRQGDKDENGNTISSNTSKKVDQLCLTWVYCVYEKVGQPCKRGWGNAYGIKADSGYTSGTDNIPIGACVAFPSKTEHGHSAIYVGNGEIVHAYGPKVVKTTIQNIIDDGYTEVGWSWIGGTPAGDAIDGVKISSNNSEGKTIVQAILDGIRIKDDSAYGKITNSFGNIFKTIGGSSGNTAGNPTAKSFGATKRNGTITLPAGLGKSSTYMGWQMITSPSSNQYKLRQDAGMNFNSNGLGIIDGRYVVATTSKFGDVGDYITVKMSDGSSYDCIIGDIKSYGDDGVNEWGHENGSSVVEAIVNKDTWYSRTDEYNHSQIPWRNGSSVESITNSGNYWGRGSYNKSSILPYKIKSHIATMTPNIPERMKNNGRGMVASPRGVLSSSRNALGNRKNINLEHEITKAARGVSNLSSSSSVVSKPNEMNSSDAMLAVLNTIAEILMDIRTSNNKISEKNFSPVIGVNGGSNNGSFIPNTNRKSSLVDNIISGI